MYLICIEGYCQIDSLFVIENYIDNLRFNETEIDGDLELSEEVIETIHENMSNGKPNVNNLNYETAVRTLQLTDYQYYQLQLYIETHGMLYSIYELSCIKGFEKEDIARLENRVQILEPPKRMRNIKNFMSDGKNFFLFRYGQVVERQVGYDKSYDKHYEGSPMQLMLRYEYTNLGNFGVKFACAKDPGDEFFKGAQKMGFKRYSGSVYLQNIGWLKRLVVGDFRVSFAQGLIAGQSLLSGIGSDLEGIRVFAQGIRPVAVNGKSNYYRGVGVSLGNNMISGSAFIGERVFTDYGVAGVSIKYNNSSFSVGAQAVCAGVNTENNRYFGKIGAVFRPSSLNVSIDYRLAHGGQLLFGEFAIDDKARLALLQTCAINISQHVRLGLMLRHYSQGYNAVAGQGFKASSGQTGESGLYLTGTIFATRRLEAMVYADYCRLHWLSHSIESPANCADLGMCLTYKPRRNSTLIAKYRWKNKPKNMSNDGVLRRLNEQSSHKIKLQWCNEPFVSVKLKTEVSIAVNHYEKEGIRKGVLLYQDMAFRIPRPDISIHLRAAYFDTDSYDERLYAYEDDVYYAFNVGSYYYQGIRGYIVLKYKIRNFSVWVRASRTHYLNRDKIGSGINLIEKPHKTDVRAQCVIRF